MSALEKIEYFEKKQAEMLAFSAELNPKIEELEAEFASMVDQLKAEYQDKIDVVKKPLIEMGEIYRAELKVFAGFTDGEKTNVLDVVRFVLRAKALD